jgi:hypothetical protein
MIICGYCDAKTDLFSMQIGMPQTNALKSIGYTDTVLFLTIGKPDIYQHKSLGKSATVFYPSILKSERVTNNYRNWLPTYLIFSAIDIWLTNIQPLYIYHIIIVGKSTVSYKFQIYFQAVKLFA